MILPIGLGHKHIQVPAVTWLIFVGLSISYFIPNLMEQNDIRFFISALIILSLTPYHEFRSGSLFTAMGLVLFSMLSLRYVGFQDRPYLDSFCGASWLMGSYLILFYRKSFKVSLWRIINWKVLSVETSLFIPIFFISAWWLNIYAGDYHKESLLQHIVPLFCFLLGLISGGIYKKLDSIPTHYLYKFEWKRWERLVKQKSPTKKMVRVASAIFHFNPENSKVRYDICKKIVKDIKNNETLDKETTSFFLTELDNLLVEFAKNRKVDSGIDILVSLPLLASYQKFLSKLTGGNLIYYGRAAERKHLNLLTITLYVAFLDKNFNSSKSPKLLKKVDYLLESEMERNQNISELQFLELNTSQVEVKNLFKQHFQFSRTAVVTGLHKKTS